jgi:hypothetical protein
VKDRANLAWQRELAISHWKLGEVALEQEPQNYDHAREASDRSLDIKKLADSYGEDRQWQDLLFKLYKQRASIAIDDPRDWYPEREAFARAASNQLLDIAKRWHEADPKNKEWERNLSLGYRFLGELELNRCNLMAAREASNQSLAIARRLREADHKNEDWNFDLAIILRQRSNIERNARQFEAAREALAESLTIAKHLKTLNPLGDLEKVQANINSLTQGESDEPLSAGCRSIAASGNK